MNIKFSLNIKYIVTCSLLTTLVFLTGCAGDVNMLPTLTKDSTLTNEQGVVVVRIINTSSYPLPFNQLTIAPKNLNESKAIKPSRLVSIAASTTNSVIFSAPIKAGSYALNSIRSFHSRGDYFYSRWAVSDAKFGTFEVEAGKVTDLGIIIYYQKPQEDKYLDTLLRVPSATPAEALKTYFPFYSFDEQQLLTWSKDDYQDDRDALFTSIAQNPISYNTTYVAPDNSVYFIGKLGVILKRTADKEWLLDAVDTNVDLSTIVQNSHGDLAVGGDEGHVYFKQEGGDWQNISLDKQRHVDDLFFDEKGNIEVISRTDTHVQVAEKSLANLSSAWQEKATYSSLDGWKDANGESLRVSVEPAPEPEKVKKKRKVKTKVEKIKRIMSVTTNRENNTISIDAQSLNAQLVFSSHSQKEFSFEPDSWKISDYENQSNISRTFQAGAVKLGIEFAGFWSWTGKSTYYKQNNETNDWQKISTYIITCKEGYKVSGKVCIANGDSKQKIKIKRGNFTFRGIPWFSSTKNGIAIASFSDVNFWTGKHNSEIKILKTQDGGKSWTVTDLELPNKFCTNFVSQVKDALLLSCNGISSDFYQSDDQGITWQHVREQENF